MSKPIHPSFTDPLQGAQFLVDQHAWPIEHSNAPKYKRTVYRTDAGPYVCFVSKLADAPKPDYLLQEGE